MNNELADQKKKLITIIIAVGVVLTLFLAIKTLEALKQYMLLGRGVQPQTTILVSGTGEVVVIPDTAEFSFSVISDAATVDMAQADATKKTNAAIAVVKGFGIEDNDIKTTGYNIYPRYEYLNKSTICTEYSCPPSGNRKLVGYEVSQSISVKVRKISDAGSILAKLGGAGVSNISGLTFSLDKEDAAKDEARGKAIADAQKKATTLARQLGVKLVRVVSFSESGNYPIYYAKSAVLGMGGGPEAAPAPELPAGENTITSNVNITYEIE
jgi:uncharacterized protein YggE